MAETQIYQIQSSWTSSAGLPATFSNGLLHSLAAGSGRQPEVGRGRRQVGGSVEHVGIFLFAGFGTSGGNLPLEEMDGYPADVLREIEKVNLQIYGTFTRSNRY
jgi:hypothetical protein